MTVKAPTSPVRRQPKQRRARQTVDAILDAVVRLLKREGLDAITTNRIAEVAGVSIGSLYQYFPDKRAIFAGLHERHIEQIDRMVEAALVKHAGSSLEELVPALIGSMVDAHTTDPKLYELLSAEVPHRAGGTQDFSVRHRGAFLIAISSRSSELKKGRDLETVVFAVTHMIDALSHGAVLRRPRGLSLNDAKAEAVRAVLAYLRA
jgi:AcrR family transcriptional regulator